MVEGRMNYWGFHMILDCASCDTAVVTDTGKLTVFVKELVEKIKMKAYGEPVFKHFANHNPAAGGYTMVQLIETSDITGHFVDSTGDAYLDIFSCAPFDQEIVKAVVQEHLKPKGFYSNFFYRKVPSI